MQHHMASSAPGSPGGLAGQLEGGQAAPPWVLGQFMLSCAACHAGSFKGRLQMPSSGVDPPDRRRWGAAGCSRQPQQAQNQDAPSICFSEHTHSRLLSEASKSIEE